MQETFVFSIPSRRRWARWNARCPRRWDSSCLATGSVPCVLKASIGSERLTGQASFMHPRSSILRRGRRTDSMRVNMVIDHAASSTENGSLMAGSGAFHGFLGSTGVLGRQRLWNGYDVRSRHRAIRERSRQGPKESEVLWRPIATRGVVHSTVG
jgi:hypothetical protein